MYYYDGPHFHVKVMEQIDEQRAQFTYDHVSIDPMEAITQFAAVVAMVDHYDYETTVANLVDYCYESFMDGEAAAVVVGGTKMAEVLYECSERCQVSPQMN